MFSMVVICDGIEKDILDVAAICHALNIPLVWIRIYGFIGYCRILVAEHTGRYFELALLINSD